MSSRENLEKLIQEYGKSMYKAGFKDGFIQSDNFELNNSEPRPGNLFNEISILIDAM